MYSAECFYIWKKVNENVFLTFLFKKNLQNSSWKYFYNPQIFNWAIKCIFQVINSFITDAWLF